MRGGIRFRKRVKNENIGRDYRTRCDRALNIAISVTFVIVMKHVCMFLYHHLRGLTKTNAIYEMQFPS